MDEKKAMLALISGFHRRAGPLEKLRTTVQSE